MSAVSNLIVMSLFLNELSSNLVLEFKIRSLFMSVAKKLILLLFAANEKTLTQIWSFLAKPVLKIGLPWQQLRSLVTKKYTK